MWKLVYVVLRSKDMDKEHMASECPAICLVVVA